MTYTEYRLDVPGKTRNYISHTLTCLPIFPFPSPPPLPLKIVYHKALIKRERKSSQVNLC